MSIHYKVGDRDTRPWGTWEVIAVGEHHIAKKIMVNPGEQLSLQLHHYRDEHWVIAEGVAEVVLGEKVFLAHSNTHIFIPVGAKHRITNKTQNPVIFIEVQAGENLDENDIVRLEDRYGRT